MNNKIKSIVIGAGLVALVALGIAAVGNPTFPRQTWKLDNGTIGLQIGADGGLSYIRGVAYTSWPSSNSAGVLGNDGSGHLIWSQSGSNSLGFIPLTAVQTTQAVAQATSILNNLTLLTNAVVRTVVTNGNGSITVTTTNLVYLGLRP